MTKKASGIHFLLLAILAFAGIGLEVVLAFGIEPLIYGTPLNEWSDLQAIVHWIVTCTLWGAVSFGIVRLAKNKYGFDLFQRGSKLSA